jgi:hypothetical protein
MGHLVGGGKDRTGLYPFHNRPSLIPAANHRNRGVCSIRVSGHVGARHGKTHLVPQLDRRRAARAEWTWGPRGTVATAHGCRNCDCAFVTAAPIPARRPQRVWNFITWAALLSRGGTVNVPAVGRNTCSAAVESAHFFRLPPDAASAKTATADSAYPGQASPRRDRWNHWRRANIPNGRSQQLRRPRPRCPVVTPERMLFTRAQCEQALDNTVAMTMASVSAAA